MLGLNEALSTLKPADSEVSRMIRDDQRMVQLNNMVQQKEYLNMQLRSEVQDRFDAVGEGLSKFNPNDAAKIQQYNSERYNQIKEEFVKSGGIDKFIKRGGMELIREWENQSLNSPIAQQARRNREMEVKYWEAMKDPKMANRISANSSRQYMSWLNGERDGFELTMLSELKIPTDRYAYTEQITPEVILDENWYNLYSDYYLEMGEYPASREDLLQYTRTRFSGVRGGQDPMQVLSASERLAYNNALARGRSNSDGTGKGQYYIESLFQSTRLMNEEEKNRPTAKRGSLMENIRKNGALDVWTANGLKANQPQRQYVTKGDNGAPVYLQDSYIMGDDSKGNLLMTGMGYENDGGYFSVASNNLYDGMGIMGRNYENGDQQVRVRAVGVVVGKGIDNFQNVGYAYDDDLNQYQKVLVMDSDQENEDDFLWSFENAGTNPEDVKTQVKNLIVLQDEEGNIFYKPYIEDGESLSVIKHNTGDKLISSDEALESQKINAGVDMAKDNITKGRVRNRQIVQSQVLPRIQQVFKNYSYGGSQAGVFENSVLALQETFKASGMVGNDAQFQNMFVDDVTLYLAMPQMSIQEARTANLDYLNLGPERTKALRQMLTDPNERQAAIALRSAILGSNPEEAIKNWVANSYLPINGMSQFTKDFSEQYTEYLK